MNLFRNVLPVFPILAMLVAVPAEAAAILWDGDLVASVNNPSPAGASVGPSGAVGGVGGPYFFNSPYDGRVKMTVTDCCTVGDVFEAFIDGVSLGFTAPVPIGGPVNSTGVFYTTVTAGFNYFDVNDQILSYIGSTSPYGGTVPLSFTPAGLHVQVEFAPEPGSMILLGAGLVGLTALARRVRKV